MGLLYTLVGSYLCKTRRVAKKLVPKTITNVIKVVTTCINLSIYLSANNTADSITNRTSAYILYIIMDKDMDSTGLIV